MNVGSIMKSSRTTSNHIVIDSQRQLHHYTAIHDSSPVASWDIKVSIWCALQSLAEVICVLFVYYIVGKMAYLDKGSHLFNYLL